MELKINTPPVKLYLKKDEVTGLPIQKMIFSFDIAHSMEDIIDCVYNYQRRKEWDYNVIDFRELAHPNPYFYVYYMSNKFPFPLPNRDFVEKRIIFMKDNTYYIFFSATHENVKKNVLNIIKVEPKQPKLIRGHSLMGASKITIENNQIRYMIYSLIDSKVKIEKE
jgi:hypothetical protein